MAVSETLYLGGAILAFAAFAVMMVWASAQSAKLH
jgi:hypothetical protein